MKAEEINKQLEENQIDDSEGCQYAIEALLKCESRNKELIETLKDEQARIVLLSDGYEDLEVQHKRYLNVLKIYLESALESINSKNQQK